MQIETGDQWLGLALLKDGILLCPLAVVTVAHPGSMPMCIDWCPPHCVTVKMCWAVTVT